MTVKLLVDRKIDGKDYKVGELCDTDDATEAGLISSKLAIADLTGGTNHVPRPEQVQYVPVTASTNLTGGITYSGPDGATFQPVQNYTFATLPAAATNAGLTARVTDLANSLWESNGTRWRPVNGRVVLKQLATAYSMSGTTAVKAFEAVLPAGCLGNGDTLQLRYNLDKSGTAETGTITVRAGAAGTTADTTLSAFAPIVTTNISAGILADYKRLSATSLRKMGNGANNSAFAGQSTAAVPAAVAVSSMDAAATYLTIWMVMSAAVETATLHDCILELVSAA